MASKGAKETIANKLGFKSHGQRSVETELERVRKENAQLKKTLDEISKRNAKPLKGCESDQAKLMEKIVALETLREKNSKQLLAKEQELVTLRQHLQSGRETSLQNQLEQKKNEVEQREKAFQALSQEVEELKDKLVTATQRCQALEKCSTDLQVFSGDTAVIQEQLRDALEKNQHWLVYDQQREAYVQGTLARMMELEQQLNQAKQTLQKLHKEDKSEDQLFPPVEQQQVLQQELENQREQACRLQAELEDLKICCEGKKQEAAKAQTDLQEERQSTQKALTEERKLAAERMARLQNELEVADVRLEEERKKTAELLLQVNLLQKSLLKQNEEHKRIAVLEQQIQMSAKDFENEKLNRQNLQHQLHKVLKELRKARDQITCLASVKRQRDACFTEPNFNGLDIQDRILTTTSPAKHNALDESFLECPNCRTSYPTSQHRELLMHLDYCFN